MFDLEKLTAEARRILREMCAIPAPSHHEEKRAEYVRAYWEHLGAKNVYIDEAKNCVWEADTQGEVTLFCAHTDTVFPDMEPMPMREENGTLYCPGCGDDTANLAVMLAATRYMLESGMRVKGCIFAANSCEEGLGNLKGIRALMARYAHRVKQVIAFDCHLGVVTDIPVGSERYEIIVRTQGGHSFSDYGRPNAVHLMSKIVCQLCESPLPEGEGVATRNVGLFEGGTSVNTIPQYAAIMYEYRTNSRSRMNALREAFRCIMKEHPEAEVRLLGERPCVGDVDRAKQVALVEKCLDAVEKYIGMRPKADSASTDCNIPLSMGIPACCVGACRGGGMHTREEWVQIDSLKEGLQVAWSLIGSELA